MTTSRRNSRARRSNPSPSSAPSTPAKPSRRRSPIASGDRRQNLLMNKDPTMNPEFRAAILQALQLTRSQNVMEATRVIQRAIADLQRPAPPVDEPRERAPALPPPPELTRTADAVEPPQQRAHTANSGEAATERRPSGRPRRRLGDVLKLLRQAELSGLGRGAAPLPGLRKAPTVVAPEGAAYLGRSFACAAGARDYKVYVPSGAAGRALPLIVMLHGCTQHPDEASRRSSRASPALSRLSACGTSPTGSQETGLRGSANRSPQNALQLAAEKEFGAWRPEAGVAAAGRKSQSLWDFLCTPGAQVPDMPRIFRKTVNRVISMGWLVERREFEPHASGRCIRGHEAFFHRA